MIGKQLFGGLLAASVLWSGAASATSVNVDFSGGQLVDIITEPTVVGTPPFDFSIPTTTATWQENGFNTVLRNHTDLQNYGILPDQTTTNLFRNLSDQDPGADFVGRNMEISREDGALFDLLRIGTGGSYEGLAVFADFIPAIGSGLAAAQTIVPLLGPSLSLVGVKADGSVVTGSGTTKTAANWQPNGFGPGSTPESFGAIDVQFSDQVLNAFTDLRSLTLSVFGYHAPGSAAEAQAVEASLQDLGAPSILLSGFASCGLTTGIGSCTVAGVGEFSFFVDLYGGRNDFQNVFITDFDLRLTGEFTTPVQAPLPASAWLLIAGCGAIATLRRRRKVAA